VFRDGTDPGVDDFDDDAATDVHERDDALREYVPTAWASNLPGPGRQTATAAF
jgi:hypothetical protein